MKNKQEKDIGDFLALRKPKYKKVKLLMPHCPICEEMLSGNNSVMSPFRCSCGEWVDDFMNTSLFKIKVKSL